MIDSEKERADYPDLAPSRKGVWRGRTMATRTTVIPTEAGIQLKSAPCLSMDPRLRGDDEPLIPGIFTILLSQFTNIDNMNTFLILNKRGHSCQVKIRNL